MLSFGGVSLPKNLCTAIALSCLHEGGFQGENQNESYPFFLVKNAVTKKNRGEIGMDLQVPAIALPVGGAFCKESEDGVGDFLNHLPQFSENGRNMTKTTL